MSVAGIQMEQYTKVQTYENEKISEKAISPLQYGYGIRHIQLVIFFTCLCTTFLARAHLGVTVVAMTSHHRAKDIKNITFINGNKFGNETSDKQLNYIGTIENDTMGRPEHVTMGPNKEYDIQRSIYRTYNWSKPIQETILSSFFVGYCLTTFPAALVCQRWGGKVPLQASLLVNGLVSLFTPWLTSWGNWKAVCACRVLQGLSQAGTYPGIQTLLAKWVPIRERATFTSYLYTGSTVGNIVAFQISGILSASAWSWPSIFWVVGVTCLLCFVLLTVFGSSTPLAHKTISEEEKSYIISSRLNETTVVQKRRTAPWKAILTSGPVWANFATHVGSSIGFFFFLTQVPSYIHYVLGIDVKSSGLLSSLPYLASFFTSIAFGNISDYLTNKKIISVKTARILFNSISQVGVAVCLISASFANSITLAISCFVFSMSCHTAAHAGWMLNHIDLSPEYGGTLMALGNTLMNVILIIMPVVVSNVVIDVRNPFQWRIMLFLVAGVSFFTNIVFAAFLSVDVQPWNDGAVDGSKEDTDKPLPNESESEKRKL